MLKKIANVDQKIQICDVKNLKPVHYIKKLYIKLLSNPTGGSLALSLKKLKKIASFIKKIARICDIKKIIIIPWPKKNFSVTYYQTIKEVF